jgi:TRAP-type mannitol/chloroaromatic compound transport system substrate-binding protein
MGALGDGWFTVRLKFLVSSAVAATLVGTAGPALADPSLRPVIPLKMQTTFNPNLPGAGEGVRQFAKSLKQMSGGELIIKMIEPGKIAPVAATIEALADGNLEAAFTWSGYGASKSSAFELFSTVPFGPGPEELVSWIAEGDGGKIHRAAYEKLGVVGLPCGVQGPEGGGWFRGEFNSVSDIKGSRLRYTKLAGEVMQRLGATVVPLPPGEFFWHLQQGKVDGGEMSTPAMDLALGFDKLGLPYYMPGWHQPSALLDFQIRKDKWEGLTGAQRAQVQTACRANIAYMLGRSPHLQAEALMKMQASGINVKPWSPELLDAFQRETDVVLKDLAARDPEFAASWANQRTFVDRGKNWRTISRVPAAQ